MDNFFSPLFLRFPCLCPVSNGFIQCIVREGGERGRAGGGRHQVSDSGGYFPCVEFHVHYLKWLAVGRKAGTWLLFISAAVTANIKNTLRGLIECLMMLFCDRPELHVCISITLEFFFFLRQMHVKKEKNATFCEKWKRQRGRFLFWKKNLFRDKLTLGVISLLEKWRWL